jgi:hypothetical protein
MQLKAGIPTLISKPPTPNLENLPGRQLPVVLAPASGELLTSWITRHAAFYGVSPILMLQHCLPVAPSIRAIDLDLNDEQAVVLAHSFRSDTETIRRMSFSTTPQSARRMIAAKATQYCPNCVRDDDVRVTRKFQLQGWRISCPICDELLLDYDNNHITEHQTLCWDEAYKGQALFENEAQGEDKTWAAPSEIAKLLLMRRNPRAVDTGVSTERFRVLGIVCPEFDIVISNPYIALPMAGRPTLSLALRPLLLIAVARVEHEGPGILDTLLGSTLGGNRDGFAKFAAKILGP